MSFHTFEARKRIELDEYKRLKDGLFYHCKKRKIRFYLEKNDNPESTTDIKLESLKNGPFNSKDIRICNALEDKGIIIKLVQFVSRNFDGHILSWYNGVWFRVNPRRVIDDNEYVGILNIKDVENMLKTANSLVKGVNGILPSLNECKLKRLDFCRNVYLKIQELVEMYIDMIKRCNVPPGLTMEKFYDKKVRKKIFSKDGIKLSRGSVAIIVYNKMAQMCKQDYPYPDISAAEGILRFEVQAYYKKLDYLGRKNGIKALKDFLNHGEEFATQQFNYYLPKMFCTGDYYNYETAEKKIMQSDNMLKIKQGMLRILKKSSIHKSLSKAINEMSNEGFSKSQINLLLKKFDDLGVNPCTLPRRWQVENSLPNPLKLVNGSRRFRNFTSYTGYYPNRGDLNWVKSIFSLAANTSKS